MVSGQYPGSLGISQRAHFESPAESLATLNKKGEVDKWGSAVLLVFKMMLVFINGIESRKPTNQFPK